jgi:PAS domain S-box-containing protein
MKITLDLHGRCGECLLFGAIEGLEDGLVLVDPQGIIFHVNRRAEEFIGISAPKVMGTKLRACLKPPPLLRFWNSALREKEVASTELAMAGGVQLRATVSLCRSMGGEPIGRALLLRDITREKRIQVDLPLAVAQRLVEMTGAEEGAAESVPLTSRERQILALLSAGLSNAAVAAKLHVSANTVASHLKHLYPKIGVHSRSQAVAYAMSRGIRPSTSR